MNAVQSLQESVNACSSRGHFTYESGHHGELWIDLDRLLDNDERMEAWVLELAGRVRSLAPQVVCGPMTGGARLARRLAAILNAACVFTDRDAAAQPVRYRLPPELHAVVSGSRVVLVDDAINAGSAVRASLGELKAHNATVVAIGCLLTLNAQAQALADAHGIPLVSLLQMSQSLWTPADCPICRRT